METNKTPNDRSTWGEGPWDGEPDHVEWNHDGFACLAHRNGVGAWCGYVGLEKGHWAYEKDYDRVDVNVHGGLTYANHSQGEISRFSDELPEKSLWWVGFDCSHMSDLSPGMKLAWNEGTYRTLAYVKGQVTGLVFQLKGAANLRPDLYAENEE